MILHQGQVWARHVEYAVKWHERMRGLLGRTALGDDAALVIKRCGSVHTLGMKFAIDLVFVDKANRIVKIKGDVRPGHFCVWGGWHAMHVIESESGKLNLNTLKIGDTLEMRPAQSGVYAMCGYAATFRKTRRTADWMKELREGEEE